MTEREKMLAGQLYDCGAIIMPGVKIGDNVVIGAGSVFTKDIPSNKVAYGNPCKVARENI